MIGTQQRSTRFTSRGAGPGTPSPSIGHSHCSGIGHSKFRQVNVSNVLAATISCDDFRVKTFLSGAYEPASSYGLVHGKPGVGRGLLHPELKVTTGLPSPVSMSKARPRGILAPGISLTGSENGRERALASLSATGNSKDYSLVSQPSTAPTAMGRRARLK